jgi:hypothetical protein
VSGVNGQGLGKVPECRFHGLVMPGSGRTRVATCPRAASHRPAELDELVRRTAVLAGWELFKTQLHIHHTALGAR